MHLYLDTECWWNGWGRERAIGIELFHSHYVPTHQPYKAMEVGKATTLKKNSSVFFSQ